MSAPDRPHIDADGRSTAIERPLVDAGAYVELASQVLGLNREMLRAKTRSEDLNELRDRVVAVGVERYRLLVVDLADVLGRGRETVSRWLSRASRRKGSSPEFSARLDELDRRLAAQGRAKVT